MTHRTFSNELTLSTLIARLQAIAEAHEGIDPIVRIAHQPHYPFEHALLGAVEVNLSAGDQEDYDANCSEEEQANIERPEDEYIVYLAASESNEYLPCDTQDVWGAL